MNRKKLYMQNAIDLAIKGKYTTSPNPNVGCIIVEGNKILSKSYHCKSGKDHAEVIALKNLKKKVNEKMVMYINLEPCCHTGKTGPCTKTIIDSGIKNIEIAMLDPNPVVKGKGVKELRKNGINVSIGLCKNEAIKINEDFITRHKKNRPYIVLKQAISTDFRITNPKSKWISSNLSREDSHFHRAESCAILIGSNTVRKDDPKLNVRLSKEKLSVSGSIRQPVKVILDSRLTLNINRYKVFGGKTKKIIFNSVKTKSDHKRNIDYIKVKKEKIGLDLNLIMKILANEYEIKRLLVEPGKELFSNFLSKEIFDEIIYYKSPVFVGNSGLHNMNTEKSYLKNRFLILDSVKILSNDVKIRYKLKE